MLLALALLLSLAMAATPEERAHQQDVVAEAAAAVARARADGARRRDVAELMVSYRLQAEALASMEPPSQQPDEADARAAALAALAEATAADRADDPARAEIGGWLGQLEDRLDLLDGALVAAGGISSPSLARGMLGDVDAQCRAVMVAAAYDATLDEEQSRRARLRAMALRSGESPRQTGGIDIELDVRALEAEADQDHAAAAAAWLVRDRAVALRQRADAALAALPNPAPPNPALPQSPEE